MSRIVLAEHRPCKVPTYANLIVDWLHAQARSVHEVVSLCAGLHCDTRWRARGAFGRTATESPRPDEERRGCADAGIWDVGNQAQDDHGNPDASKLKADDWNKVISAAGKVRQVAQTLAQTDHVVVAAPGTKLDDQSTPGALSVMEMRAAIDADPAAFRASALALNISMDQIVAATKAKNATKLFDASGGLDEVCENCHMRFWYPEQKTPR